MEALTHLEDELTVEPAPEPIGPLAHHDADPPDAEPPDADRPDTDG